MKVTTPSTLRIPLLAAASLLTSALLSLPASAQTTPSARARPLPYTGTNLSSAEFGGVKSGDVGKIDKAYTYPNKGEIDYFTKAGMNVFRLPFRWERLQPTPKGELDAAELARLKATVQAATSKGSVVILDPHNYARYYDDIVGGSKVGADVFADLWKRLATAFKGDGRVWFGLVNEPHDMPGDVWLSDANAAIAAIRTAGAKNRILVPGIAWTGAHSWVGSGNGATMLGVVDPAHNYAIRCASIPGQGQFRDASRGRRRDDRQRASAGVYAVVSDEPQAGFSGRGRRRVGPHESDRDREHARFHGSQPRCLAGIYLVGGGTVVGRLYVHDRAKGRQGASSTNDAASVPAKEVAGSFLQRRRAMVD